MGAGGNTGCGFPVCKCEVAASSKIKLNLARSALQALSEGVLPKQLDPPEREIVEAAVDKWCTELSTDQGSRLCIGGKERGVTLSNQPLALVVQGSGTYPVSFVEKMEPHSSFCAGHCCVLTFAPNPWENQIPPSPGGGAGVIGAEGRISLTVAFEQTEDQMSFMIMVRALQLLVPDLQKAPNFGHSFETGGGDASSDGSLASRRSCDSSCSKASSNRRKKRQRSKRSGSKQRAEKSQLAPHELLNVSHAILDRKELHRLLGPEEPVKPVDSPSGRTMRPALPEFLKLSPNRRRGSRRPSDLDVHGSGDDIPCIKPLDSPSAKGVIPTMIHELDHSGLPPGSSPFFTDALLAKPSKAPLRKDGTRSLDCGGVRTSQDPS